MKKYCVLYNPASEGGYGSEIFNQELFSCFETLPRKPYAIFETQRDLKNVWKTILDLNPEFVFVCGGDGTVNQVVNEMIRTRDLPIAIVPFGNGNDFSRSLYISREYHTLVHFLYHSAPKKVDVGKIEFNNKDHYFLNEMSIGISSAVINSVRNSIFPKNWAFMMYGITNQLFPEKQRLEYKTKDTSDETEVKLFTISNGKFFGNGMNIQPEASIEDGVFNVSLIENTSLFDTFKIMNSVYKGEKVSSVKYFTCDEIYLKGNSQIEADGEIIGNLPCKVSNLKQRIQVIY